MVYNNVSGPFLNTAGRVTGWAVLPQKSAAEMFIDSKRSRGKMILDKLEKLTHNDHFSSKQN